MKKSDHEVEWAPFKALRVVREGTFTVFGTPEQVFALLCPVREYDWIDGWRCQMVFSESGVAERDCVFLTDSDGIWTWTFSEWEPPLKLGIVRMSDRAVVRYEARIVPQKSEKVEVRWCEIATALSEKGNAYVAENWSESCYDKKMKRLEESLDRYLRTGYEL